MNSPVSLSPAAYQEKNYEHAGRPLDIVSEQ
jgi:hypothetical protein